MYPHLKNKEGEVFDVAKYGYTLDGSITQIASVPSGPPVVFVPSEGAAVMLSACSTESIVSTKLPRFWREDIRMRSIKDVLIRYH